MTTAGLLTVTCGGFSPALSGQELFDDAWTRDTRRDACHPSSSLVKRGCLCVLRDGFSHEKLPFRSVGSTTEFPCFPQKCWTIAAVGVIENAIQRRVEGVCSETNQQLRQRNVDHVYCGVEWGDPTNIFCIWVKPILDEHANEFASCLGVPTAVEDDVMKKGRPFVNVAFGSSAKKMIDNPEWGLGIQNCLFKEIRAVHGCVRTVFLKTFDEGMRLG